MTHCAKQLIGLHTANTISKGFWVHNGLAAQGVHYAQLSCGFRLTEDSQQHDQAEEPASSSTSQDPSADSHPCSPRTGHLSDSTSPRTDTAPSLRFQPLLRQHQRSYALGACRGLLGPASRNGLYTFASYSSTSGPSTTAPLPLSQSDSSASISAGGLRSMVAEANSILQVRLNVDPDYCTCCKLP